MAKRKKNDPTLPVFLTATLAVGAITEAHLWPLVASSVLTVLGGFIGYRYWQATRRQRREAERKARAAASRLTKKTATWRYNVGIHCTDPRPASHALCRDRMCSCPHHALTPVPANATAIPDEPEF